MEFFKDLFVLLGRICISGAFLWGAYEKVTNWQATLAHMRAKGVPQLNIVMPICIALKVIGGLLVLSGWYPHFGALLLLIVAVPALIKLHGFWHLQGAEKALQKAIFVKEVAVIGGLLLLLAIGAGHFAV